MLLPNKARQSAARKMVHLSKAITKKLVARRLAIRRLMAKRLNKKIKLCKKRFSLSKLAKIGQKWCFLDVSTLHF